MRSSSHGSKVGAAAGLLDRDSRWNDTAQTSARSMGNPLPQNSFRNDASPTAQGFVLKRVVRPGTDNLGTTGQESRLTWVMPHQDFLRVRLQRAGERTDECHCEGVKPNASAPAKPSHRTRGRHIVPVVANCYGRTNDRGGRL
jgi:hypothetical protein